MPSIWKTATPAKGNETRYVWFSSFYYSAPKQDRSHTSEEERALSQLGAHLWAAVIRKERQPFEYLHWNGCLDLKYSVPSLPQISKSLPMNLSVTGNRNLDFLAGQRKTERKSYQY